MLHENPRPLRVTFVYEYAPKDDWMLGSLITSLTTRLPGLQAIAVHGLFPTYRPGGFNLQRLTNLIWVYLRVALHLVFSRPDAVLVRTTPPGVQLWTVWWARFRRVPVFCWLMDCHPEMEARQLERCGYKGIARLLRRVDEGLMPRFAAIIALDKAMADFARTRAAGVTIVQHPTWAMCGASAWRPVSYCPGEGGGVLRLAYSGNLGVAHDLSALGALLEELARRRPVQLFMTAASPAGEERFRKLGERLGIPVETNPWVPITELRALYEKWRIDAGVVLLAAESAGLVSPSKFSGYINLSIPIIYLGPPNTNTAEVCTRFGGGFWVPLQPTNGDLVAVVDSLLDAPRMAKASGGVRAAATYFAGLDNESLAELLAPLFWKLRE